MKIKTNEEIDRAYMDTFYDAKCDEPNENEAFIAGAKWMQDDILESASEGFEEWSRNHEYFEGPLDWNETNLAHGRPINSTDVYSNTEEAWQACSLHHAKLLKEKDDRIKELTYYKEMWQSIAGQANLTNLVKHAGKYQEAVKDMEWALDELDHSHYEDCRYDDDDNVESCDCGRYQKTFSIKGKYGLDKQEREK